MVFERFKKRSESRERKGTDTGSEEATSTPYPGAPPARQSVTDSPRTTSYPQGTKGSPPRAGEIRTTSYPSALQWNRRGVDAIN